MKQAVWSLLKVNVEHYFQFIFVVFEVLGFNNLVSLNIRETFCWELFLYIHSEDELNSSRSLIYSFKTFLLHLSSLPP